MQNKFLKKFTVLFALGTILTSCGDFKNPIEGYITDDAVTEIVNGFKEVNEYTRYSYEGNLNYFEYSEDLVPTSIKRSNVEIKDKNANVDDAEPDYSLEGYTSYYLRLPLHVSPSKWKNETTALSLQYQIESKIYRPAGLDSIYYYRRDNGGFILRTFGVNKALIIKNPSDITCRGKWNIEVEYNADGYLVREHFATVNASEDNKSECCYGQATYTYSK